MKRLERVETDVRDLKNVAGQMSHVLVELSERTDTGFRQLHGELQGVTARLDRLIEVTIRERTLGTERLADLEARLARLERQGSP